MNITRVELKNTEGRGRLKSVATITIDDCFVVHDIRVIDGRNGLYIAMPSRKTPTGDFRDIAHPINQQTRDQIESAILAEYYRED